MTRDVLLTSRMSCRLKLLPWCADEFYSFVNLDGCNLGLDLLSKWHPLSWTSCLYPLATRHFIAVAAFTAQGLSVGKGEVSHCYGNVRNAFNCAQCPPSRVIKGSLGRRKPIAVYLMIWYAQVRPVESRDKSSGGKRKAKAAFR